MLSTGGDSSFSPALQDQIRNDRTVIYGREREAGALRREIISIRKDYTATPRLPSLFDLKITGHPERSEGSPSHLTIVF